MKLNWHSNLALSPECVLFIICHTIYTHHVPSPWNDLSFSTHLENNPTWLSQLTAKVPPSAKHFLTPSRQSWAWAPGNPQHNIHCPNVVCLPTCTSCQTLSSLRVVLRGLCTSSSYIMDRIRQTLPHKALHSTIIGLSSFHPQLETGSWIFSLLLINR